MKQIYIILFLSILSATQLYAQYNASFIVYGIVSDVNKLPISDVNIIGDFDERNGGVSDSKGHFNIKISRENRFLKFSHIGFKDFIYKLDVLPDEDSLQIIVVLEKKIGELSGVEISSEKTKLVYNKKRDYIFDFEFINNNLILAVDGKNKSEIKLLNANASEVANIEISRNSKELFLDCFGNVHIVFEDSLYQLFVSSDSLSIPFRYSIEQFRKFLKYSVAVINNKLIYYEYGINNKYIDYYYYNNKKKHLLKRIIDMEGLIASRNEEIEIIKLEDKLNKKPSGMDDPPLLPAKESKLAIGREISDRENYLKFILTRPIYEPLLVVRDSAYLFDDVNDSCYVFDNEPIQRRSFSINFHKSKYWAKELLVDKAENKLYAIFEKNGIITLKQISIDNGKVLNTYKIENCIFPRKIRINRGEVYFLINDTFNGNKSSLFEQRL